jgi:catechol 2,3-dioxygenase-like lactoylglutathione lyase family enzyme
MNLRMALMALLVREYDEAIAFYTQKLGFVLVEDTDRGGGKRWVRVATAKTAGRVELLLARAVTAEQQSRVGNQTGGRVFLFFETDNFTRDYELLRQRGVQFLEQPRHEEYGTVAVFQDLYGNKFDLIQHHRPPS